MLMSPGGEPGAGAGALAVRTILCEVLGDVCDETLVLRAATGLSEQSALPDFCGGFWVVAGPFGGAQEDALGQSWVGFLERAPWILAVWASVGSLETAPLASAAQVIVCCCGKGATLKTLK